MHLKISIQLLDSFNTIITLISVPISKEIKYIYIYILKLLEQGSLEIGCSRNRRKLH